MKSPSPKPATLLAAALGLSVFFGLAQSAPAADAPAAPYKTLATTQIPAAGGYVTADRDQVWPQPHLVDQQRGVPSLQEGRIAAHRPGTQ